MEDIFSGLGGGFAGATCARELQRAGVAVTLVEASPTFTACPFSNGVIAGLRELRDQQFGYDKVKADGITVAHQTAAAVDRQARRVELAVDDRNAERILYLLGRRLAQQRFEPIDTAKGGGDR